MSGPAVSDTYVLLRDRHLPPAQQQRSFVFAAPIWPRDADPQFRGWVVLGMRGQDFLSGVLATVSQGQLDAQLLAPTDAGERPVVAAYTVVGSHDLSRSLLLEVADRQWMLVTRASSGLLPGARSGLPTAVLHAGLTLTVVLAGLVYVLATGRARALARVRDATAGLRAAEAESRRQAGLLGAVMTSIGDGVGVVDESGDFLLHNPAAQQLLGVDDRDSAEPDDWQHHYGLFRADGQTPFPTGELPLMRALHGESSRAEMIIRNRGRPEGILISVDGRPLDPSAGQRGAVAVFRDITELRRYENDLAVFAGVVAHDLKGPLSVLGGQCEMARDALADRDLDQAGYALTRVARAVDRMAAMIDTLLAYTTARDAPLRTGPVDLGALATEVVQDRIAHLPAEQRPEVYVGELPAVAADPAMLRHVLENLVGNAIKYVRPGAAARIDVTAADTAPGWTRIDVSDRGIGIPDADKPAVFERFHRAHAADGYAGTGLGLAICKRIVERHGGEVGVTDNPGGGTRFHFTLPVTDAPPAGTETIPASPAGPESSPAPPGASEEDEMSESDERDDEQTRARLERALAERAAAQGMGLPGMTPSGPPTPAAGEQEERPGTDRVGRGKMGG
jgi:signal transduction histidine kinase